MVETGLFPMTNYSHSHSHVDADADIEVDVDVDVDEDMDMEMDIDDPIEVDENSSSDAEFDCLSPQSPTPDPPIGDETGNPGSTKSLSDHVLEVICEHGRRYCDHSYLLPNDDAEQTRLNIIHQIFLILLDSQPTIIPIPSHAKRILDVGTGPGDWAVTVGELFPDAQVIATDINIFDTPNLTLAPPNVFFQIDDIEQEWTFHRPFDLIHARNLTHSVSKWPQFYAQSYKHLNPGGMLHLAESDFMSGCLRVPNDHPNSYMNIYQAAIRSARDAARYPQGTDHLRSDLLAAAGFTDIQLYELEVPIGTWPTDPTDRTLGKMGLIALLESLEAVSLRLLTKHAGWTVKEVRDLCNKVKTEIVRWQGATNVIKFAVATKPM